MERTSSVSETVLASGEFTEVTGGLGNHIIVQLEDDATERLLVRGNVKLVTYQYQVC